MKHIGALASPGVTCCGVPVACSVVRSETLWRPQGRFALAWGCPLLATSSCPAPSHLSFPADTHAYPVSISFHKPTLYLGHSSALLAASLFCSSASFLSFPISLPDPHLPALCHWFPLWAHSHLELIPPSRGADSLPSGASPSRWLPPGTFPPTSGLARPQGAETAPKSGHY